jgi:hypothetical protein
MGGTYTPENVVLLTVEQHAEAHRLLWEEHGHWQDKCAWLMLSGQTKYPLGLGGAPKGNKNRLGHKAPYKARPKMKAVIQEKNWWLGRMRSAESKQKMSEAAFRRWSHRAHESVF